MKISSLVVCLLLPFFASAHNNWGHNHQNQDQNQNEVAKHTQTSWINQGDLTRLLSNFEFESPVKALDLSFSFSQKDNHVSYFVFTEEKHLLSEDAIRLCYNGDYAHLNVKAKSRLPNGRTGAIAERDLESGSYFLYFVNCAAESGEVSLTWSAVQEDNGQHHNHGGRDDEISDSDSNSDGSDSFGYDSDSESGWVWQYGWQSVLNKGMRQDEFFYLFAAEAGVYGLGLIIWFVNWANDRNANTKLQKFFTFVPLTRLCYSVSELLGIEAHIYVGSTNLPLQISGFVFEILNMLTFFVGLEYAAYGMSTKRSDISCKRKLYSYFLASSMIATGVVSEVFGGYTFIPACVTYVVLMHNVFSCSSKCTTGFLKDVEKMRREGKNPRNTSQMEKLDTMVLFRFFLTLFTVVDVGTWAVTHFAIQNNVLFAQEACEGVKQFFFMMIFGTIFRVKSFNKVSGPRRKRKSKKRARFGRKRREQRMNSQMSYRGIDYVGMDDLPPNGGNDVVVNMESSPNALVVPQHLQGQHRQQYPTWKCEKCTALNDGPMTHCDVCEVWSCRTCTMDNPMHSEICVTCDQKRPEPDAIAKQQERYADSMRPQYWECDKCNFQNALENEFCEECESWSCLSCTMKNRLGLQNCSVCGKDRPSDLQMKMHRELEAKRRALEEAKHQNEALNKRLMERQQAEQQNYYPNPVYMAPQEAARHIVSDQHFQRAAPVPVLGDAVPEESVEMDNLKQDLPQEEPKVELRSVVSDGAIIVYDTPEGPPDVSELMKKPEEATPETGFDVFRSQAMTSIVSDSVPIHFDDAPAAAQEAPKVTIIQVEDDTFFSQEAAQTDDTASDTIEETQEQEVEDMLHLGEDEPAGEPEIEAPKEEADKEEEPEQVMFFDAPEKEQEVNTSDEVSEAGTSSYYTGADLLQFLMDSNAAKVLRDENLEKLMLQIRENASDKQTLLESLDACQGDAPEFFRMCSLMGFI